MASLQKTETYPLAVEKFYQVITDYPSYPEYMDGVDEVQVIEQSPDMAMVEYAINIIKSFRYCLRLTHQAPHRVAWTLESGDLFKKNDGSWEFADLGDGNTRVTYTLDLDFKLLVPKMIVNKLVKNNLPQLFANVYHRARSL